MSAKVSVGVEVQDLTRAGLDSALNSVTSFSKKAEVYTTLQPKINSSKFDAELNRMMSTIDKVFNHVNSKGQLVNKYVGKSLTVGKGRDKVTYDLEKAWSNPDSLAYVSRAVSGKLSRQIFSGKDAKLAEDFVRNSKELLGSLGEVEKFLVKTRDDVYSRADARKKNVITAIDSDQQKKALQAQKQREESQRRLNKLQDEYNTKQQTLQSLDGNIYGDVRRQLTTQKDIVDNLNKQAKIYEELGERNKAASAKRRATIMQQDSDITANRLSSWTGDNYNLISSFTPQNIKRQLNSISRDLTNTIGRENLLNKTLDVTGWDKSVERMKKAAMEVERTFTVGGKKFKINGLDDAVAALEKIDKMAQKGIRGASQWQQKLNEYLGAHVEIANQYQTASNKVVQAKKAEARESATAAKRMQQDAIRTVAEQERVNRAFRTQSRLLSGLTRLAMRYFSVFTVLNVGRKIVETTGFFEQQRVALEGIFNSAEKARDAIEQIKQMALKSPFETKELIGGAKQLSAYGIDKDELLETTKMLGDLSAGLGVDMSRLILAYGQVKSATVLRGQELRQFTEAGVPIVEKLAEKLTEAEGKAVSTKDVFEYISKRKVPFEMVESVLKDMTSEGGKFYNMQENLTDTLYGQVQKLKDVWTLALNDVGSGWGRFLRNMIEGAQTLIKNFRMVAATIGGVALGAGLTSWGRKLLDIANNTKEVQKAQALVNVLVKTGATQQEIAAAKTKVHATQMRALAVAAKSAVASFAISAGFTAVIAAIGALIGKFIEAQAKAREFQRALADVDLSINKDSTAKKNGLDDLIDKLGKAKNGTKEYEEALSALKGNYSEYINPKYLDYLLQEGKTVADNAEEWKNLADNIKRAIDAKAEVQRHRERAEVSRNSILDDFKNDLYVENTSSNYGDFGTVKRSAWSVHGGFNFGSTLTDKEKADVRSTIEVAAQEFFENAKSAQDATEKVFRTRIQEVGKSYGLSNQRLNVLINNAGTIFEYFKHNNVKWEEWLKELKLASKKSWEQRIQDKFSNAYQSGMDLDKKDYNKWGNVKSQEFDPFFQRNQVLSKTLDVFTNEAGNKLKGFFDNQIYFIDSNGKQITKKLDDIVINGKEGADKYRSALKQVNDALGTLRDNPSDWQALYDLSNALFDLNSTLKDTDINNYLDQIRNGFQQNTTVPGDALAVQINSFIDELVRKEVPMVLNASEFEKQAAVFEKWKVQNDAEYFAKLGELYKERKDLVKKIADFNAGKGEGKEAEVKELKERLRIVNLLINRQGYWQQEKVKVNKPKRASKTTIPNEDVEYEVVEWISKLKEAYTTYRDASQQFGAGFGIDFMKGDEHMKNMFAEFFNGVTGESFEKLQKTKVGKNSNETLYSVLKDTFITSGMEDGVMNFEKAALAMSQKLNEYYNKDTQHRKRYLQVAKELERWALSISKDNLAARAKELSKALTDITESFQRTSKNVELYGKMLEQGAHMQVKQLGLSMSDYLRPESDRARENVMQLLSQYNQEGQAQAKKLWGSGNVSRFSSVEFKNLNTLQDIENAIQTLTNIVRMNDENFAASGAGSIASEQLKKGLENLYSTYAQELANNISGEKYTGVSISDAIENAIIKSRAVSAKSRKTNAVSVKETRAVNETTLRDMQKEYADIADKLLQDLLKSNNIDFEKGYNAMGGGNFNTQVILDAFNNMMKEIKEKLEGAGESSEGILDELRRKADELKSNLRNFEIASNPIKAYLVNLKAFNNAKKEGQERYDKALVKKSNAEEALKQFTTERALSGDLVTENRLNRVAELESKGRENLTEDERWELDTERAAIAKSGLSDEDIDRYIRLQAVVVDVNKELEELGENGKTWASAEQQKALEGMQKSAERFQSEMSAIVDVTKATLNSIKAFSDSLNKLYDIMNDGENPEWMQDMSDFMGDLMDNFEALVAPIMAVITLIITLTVAMTTLYTVCTPLLIIMLAIIAVAVVVAAIIAAVQQNDRRLERQIEDLKKACEEMEHQMKLLDEQAERSTGWDAYSKRLESVGLQLKEVNDLQKQMELEDAKKNTDEDKLDEYRRSWELAKEEFLNSLKDIREELTGSVQNWADAMSSAIRSAFQNGENAARNFRNTVMESIGDIVETMLKMSILQPSIQAAMDNLLGGSVEDIVSRYQTTDENGKKTLDVAKYLEYMRKVLGDGDKMQEFYDLLKLAEDTMIEGVENLPEMLKAAYGWNSETSSLTGGIQGITEDTARTLEGLGNSSLAQLVQQTGLMQSMLNTGIAQVQLSWFDNMIQLQRQLVANSDYVHNAISEMRVGNRPLVVKMQ